MSIARKPVSLLLAILIVPAALVPLATAQDEPSHTSTDHTLLSFDGTVIAFTVHRPGTAISADPVPLILHSHGWGGSRDTGGRGDVGQMLAAGYGVLSFDARGHGDSGGAAGVHHKDAEVRDTLALLDWAYDNLDWVQHETDSGIAKDIVAGAIGGSYGGAFQTTASTYDGRLDALVPQMTWNDLRYSLAPHGVIKTVWVDALYGAGKARATLDPRIDQWYVEAMATNSFPEDAQVHFVGSNPDLTNTGAAVLFLQGMPDLLFNYNEAYRNYQDVLSSGQETALVTYLGGHVLPGVQPIGFMGPARSGEPCGAYGDLALAWFDKHLGTDTVAPVPAGVSFALEDGTCIPDVDVSAPSTWNNVSVDLTDTALPSNAGSLLVPLDVGPGVIAGTPSLYGSLFGVGDRIHFFSLVVQDGATGRTHIIDDQVTPYRTDDIGATMSFGVEMNGVATHLDADDRLFLRIDAQNEWFAHNGARTPGVSVLMDAEIVLPFLAE